MGWQSGTPTLGTTILQGIKEVCANNAIPYSVDGTNLGTASTVLCVIGEKAYAEWWGDVGWSSAIADAAIPAPYRTVLDRCLASGKKVVLVLISGRPLILNEYAQSCEAIVAAWLPGTEGGGIADVLFGDVAPVGRLSHTWPRSEDQIPINVYDTDYAAKDPLFEFGFGLTY
jgi:beta-glucosidase